MTGPRPERPTREPLDLEEIRRFTAFLEAIVADRGLLASLPEEDRVRFLLAAGQVSRPGPDERQTMSKAYRRQRRRALLEQDKATRAAAEIRVARQAEVFAAPAPKALAGPAPSGERPAAEGPELAHPKYCYVCKAEYRRLHFFYDSMCPACAALNYEKRFQTADLRGRTALVTGARVKIGYHCSLKLLRAGARVIATTRFPHDSAERYAREADFDEWGDRLEVHGLDLRHSPSVELFARWVERSHERLDFLINNACQTVRRPPGFYGHLLPVESAPVSTLSPRAQRILRGREAVVRALAGEREGASVVRVEAEPGLETGVALWSAGGPGIGIRLSAALSQIPYAFEPVESEAFPPGRTDADLQQVDLRAKNSWRLTLAEVATPELLEVHLVNAVAPFVLCSKLKPLMVRTPGRDKHIVNVSAMEGKFSRGTKTDKHPHTNMAKAALNMLTLTSAPDYLKDGIHMNAVDTGWVTDEDPHEHAQRKLHELDFQPPLDIVDGAARVVAPILDGVNTGVHVWGKFLKDYAPTEW